MRRPRFSDRTHAGAALGDAVATALARVPGAGLPGAVVVLGLPRGGVPVAAPVARRLGAPLDVVVVRKIGVPWQPELAMGAVAAVAGHEHVVRNEEVIARTGLDDADFGRALDHERTEVAARTADLRGRLDAQPIAGRTAVLVDDGLATGATMRAAVAAVRAAGAAYVLVAAPVGSTQAVAAVRAVADDVVCLRVPRLFEAVGSCYRDFRQTGDDEVRRLLAPAGPGVVG